MKVNEKNDETTDEVWKEWEAVHAAFVKQSTMDTYAYLWKGKLKPFFGKMKNIREDDVQRFIDKSTLEGTALNTLKSCVMLLGMLAKHAGNAKEWKVRYPKDYSPKALHLFENSDIGTLYGYLSEHPTLRNVGIMLCMHTGLRIGELCGVRWEDIDLENKTLQINKTVYRLSRSSEADKKTMIVVTAPKTPTSVRCIPLADSIVGALSSVRKTYNCAQETYLLSGKTACMEPRVLRRYYRDLLDKLNLPHHHFHDLRHTFASCSIENGIDPKTVSVLLGHANVKTTLDVYVHPTLRQQRQCVEGITDMLAKASSTSK